MKTALIVLLVGCLSFAAGRVTVSKTPEITIPAPRVAVQIAASDGVCTRITHRYNAQTAALEPVAANDPLGIR